MADYLVLARKYRSTTFDEVVGQEHIAQTLKSAIATGRIAHAFLFTGTRGVGKTTMARILAKALNCLSSDGPTTEPCNKCEACRDIARGEDVDVIEIDGASNRSIDDIRELRSSAIYHPNRSRYRIYYIDEVHMLTREAFNALLKTLEEPPAHVKFIFATTEAEKLPATILSRCQRFDFRNIPTPQIADHLVNICKAEKVQADAGAIFRIARAAAGSMRDGLSLLDQLLSASGGKVTEEDVVRILGTPGDERIESVVTAMAEGDAAKAITQLDELLTAGTTLESALSAVSEMFRNIMLVLTCGPESKLIELPDSRRKVVAELAKRFTLPSVVQAVTLCQNTLRNLRGLTSGRGLVEAAIVRLAAADKFVDAASLLERLERLSGARPVGPSPAPAAQGYPTARTSSYGSEKKKLTDEPAGGPTGSGAIPMHRDGGARGHVEAPAQPEPATGAAAPVADAAAASPMFSLSDLAARWPEAVAAMAQDKAYLGGLLGPAKVVAVEGEVVRIGFPLGLETIRDRCQSSAETINQALAGLIGRKIRCDFVCVLAQDAPGEAKPSPALKPNGAVVLSSQERTEIQKDPAVKAVMDFFDGSVANIVQSAVEKTAAKEEEE